MRLNQPVVPPIEVKTLLGAGSENYKTNYPKPLFCNAIRIPGSPKKLLKSEQFRARSWSPSYEQHSVWRVTGSRERPAKTLDDQRQLDQVTLAESFDLSDGPTHHPTIHVKYAPPKMTPELCLIYERPVRGKAAE
jgi:hypothetical protein